jgi:endoglucanase
MRNESLAFLKKLANAPSPSGYEEPAAEVYREYTSDFADKVTTDSHGSVQAILNPNAKTRIMLAGHIDEIGFIVHYINDDGLLFFSGVGGHDSIIPVGQRVWIHTAKGKVPGIIGRKPIHLIEAAERSKSPKLHDLWIDIGAASGDAAKAKIALGDPVTFQYEFQKLMDGRATARGFDNKAGAFVVAEALRLLKEEGGLHKSVGVYAVGTVQEEIGLRGAITSAYDVDAVTGIAVDVNFAIDHPGVSKERYGRVDLGKGPTVTRGANINPIVYKMLSEAAAAEEIGVQISPEPGRTGTDAGAMQVARSGMACGLLGIPLRYMHTPCELLELEDVVNTARLMAAYCRLVTPKTDFTPRLG